MVWRGDVETAAAVATMSVAVVVKAAAVVTGCAKRFAQMLKYEGCNKSFKDCIWSAVPNALLGVIS